MPTGFAYLTVVLVWATTPLAIKWSAEALPPVMAAMLRMMLAVMIGIPCLWLLRQRLRWDRLAVRAYAAALPGVFGAMALSYMASRYVPSGLISVVFGLAPLLSGVMMQFTAASVRLNAWHWSGCLLGVAGLAVVFSDAMTVADGMLAGLLLLLAAVTGFSISGVMVKQVAVGMPPLAQTMGALTLSLPCYALLSVCLGEQVVLGDNLSGLVAIGYLAVFGSLVGFVSYFVILSRLSAATVALVTLVTPVLALALGALFNGERLPLMALLGAGIILVALALYLLGDRRVRRLAPVGT